MALIEKIHQYTKRLQVLKPYFLILAIVLLVTAIAIMMASDSRQNDVLLIPALLGFIWLLVIFVFVNSFAEIPRMASIEDSVFIKIKLKLMRFWYWVFIVLFAIISIAILLASFKLTNIWLKDYVD